MKIRTSRLSSAEALLFTPTPARDIRDAPVEQQRVIKRLEALIESHQESTLHMNVALEAEDVLAVIEALEAEAVRSDPLQLMKCQDEIRGYARHSLYEEMLAEPSNVFLATPVSHDTTRYEAMPRAFWLDCLLGLRKEWEARLSASSPQDTAAASDTED